MRREIGEVEDPNEGFQGEIEPLEEHEPWETGSTFIKKTAGQGN